MARSAVAEMHSGFGEIRNTYHTNFVVKYTGKIPVTEQGRKEIERLLALWNQARTMTTKRLGELGEKDDGFLFGKFGIADAFFWPVLWVSCALFRSFLALAIISHFPLCYFPAQYQRHLCNSIFLIPLKLSLCKILIECQNTNTPTSQAIPNLQTLPNHRHSPNPLLDEKNVG